MTNQDFNNRLSIIVENVVNEALESHFGFVTETLQEKKKKDLIKRLKGAASDIRQQNSNPQDNDENNIDNQEGQEQEFPKKGEKKDVHKKSLKKKGGVRADFNAKEDETYNSKADDMEQSELSNLLNNGFFNIAKIGKELFPDHTPEGAQSQLRKKLKGEKSDSGKKYGLKRNEVKRLRGIMSKYLSN